MSLKFLRPWVDRSLLTWQRQAKGHSLDHRPKDSNPKCRLFLKLTSKGTWRQVFICLRPPPLLGVFEVVKQFCRLRILSNTQCITPIPVCLYGAGSMDLDGGKSITRALWRGGPWNRDFFGPWNGNKLSECHLGLKKPLFIVYKGKKDYLVCSGCLRWMSLAVMPVILFFLTASTEGIME